MYIYTYVHIHMYIHKPAGKERFAPPECLNSNLNSNS